MSLIGHLAAGALAGAVGTAAMDFVLYLRYRRDGGAQSFPRWEFASDVDSWDKASAPGHATNPPESSGGTAVATGGAGSGADVMRARRGGSGHASTAAIAADAATPIQTPRRARMRRRA